MPLFNGLNGQEEFKSDISLLCWNVQLLPDFFRSFSDDLRKKQKYRTPEIIRYLYKSGYDVIVLQEVFDANLKRQIVKGLNMRYPHIVIPKKKPFSYKSSNGIMFLSKYPLELVESIIYNSASGVDRHASKGCMLVKLEVNGLDWMIAGTHLQAGDQKIRDAQYAQIQKEIIEPFKVKHIPFMFAGDFNTARGSVSYSNMMGLWKLKSTDLMDERPYTSDTLNYWKSSGESKEIDFIFHDLPEGFNIKKYNVLRPKAIVDGIDMDLSDHYPIEMTIEW